MSLMRKVVHKKGFGVFLSSLALGLAHFASGQKTKGIVLFALQWFVNVLFVLILCIPGEMFVAIALLLGITFTGLWLFILVQSYGIIVTLKNESILMAISLIVLINCSTARRGLYFLETFTLQSNDMYPTISGPNEVTLEHPELDRLSLVDSFLKGHQYVECRSESSGIFQGPYESPDLYYDEQEFVVGDVAYVLPKSVKPYFSNGDTVNNGDLIWAGYWVTPDHIFVEKFSYRIRKPRRGELVVFKVDDSHPFFSSLTNTVFLSRIVGLPGEKVNISPTSISIDGMIVLDPDISTALAQGQIDVTDLHLLDDKKAVNVGPEKEFVLGDSEYFYLSDNRKKARYLMCHGVMSEENLIGRAVRVYWPLSRMRELVPARDNMEWGNIE